MLYGKVKRSAHTFMPLDLDEPVTDATATAHREGGLRKENISNGALLKSVEVEVPAVRKLNSTRRNPGPKPVRASPSSPAGYSSPAGSLKEDTTFDIPSSGEDDFAVERSVQKRRKLTPVGDSGTDRGTKSKSHIRVSSLSKLTSNVRNNARATGSHAANPSRPQKAPKPARGARPPRKAKTPSPETSERSSPARDASLYTTPKRAGNPLHGMFQSPTDSPSGLPLTSLSLSGTPGQSNRFIDILNVEPIPKPKTRKRLIDGMESPAKAVVDNFSSTSSSQESSDDTPAGVHTSSSRRAGGKQQGTVGETEASKDDANSLEPPARIAAKPRMTYSKERSHLSDMVLEDSQQLNHSKASGLGPLAEDLPLLASLDPVVSHEFSEDEDDLEGPGIRSIHELRQAGSSARSRIDIETLLEDVEANGSSARSQRLRGLVQLAQKLVSAEVGPDILDLNLGHRLQKCPSLQGDDMIGQTLVILCMTRLLASTDLSTSSLDEVFESSLPLGDRLLQEPRDLAQLARDRKHNVSKMLAKDVTQLCQKLQKSSLWPEALTCSPQLIHVKFLDVVLRQARRRGDFGMFLPAPTLDHLIKLLLKAGTDLDGGSKDSLLIMDLTVSVLESLTISQKWAHEGCPEAARQLAQLGPILSHFSSSDDSRRSQHLILRLLLNITNNDPSLCGFFAEPALIRALFGIVKSGLQESAFSGSVLTEPELESGILALGALSNLAEHSALFRQRTMEERSGDQSMSDWVATTFRKQVGASAEVSTPTLNE